MQLNLIWKDSLLMAANVWIVTGTSVSVYKSLNLDNELLWVCTRQLCEIFGKGNAGTFSL